MAGTTYEITLGTGGKVTVSVITDQPKEMSGGMAWAREAREQLSASHEQDEATTEPEEVPICAVHHVPMFRENGRHGSLWSCHERNQDGSFCTYRPENR